MAGELDIASAPQLSLALRGLARSGQFVTLDLRAVTFMDVAGLRAIQEARRIASEDARCMQILGPGLPAARILELTGTLDLVR